MNQTIMEELRTQTLKELQETKREVERFIFLNGSMKFKKVV